MQGEGAGAGGTYEARIRRFREDLTSALVDLGNLRRMAVHGIPDRDGLRAVAWKARSGLEIARACLALGTGNMQQQCMALHALPTCTGLRAIACKACVKLVGPPGHAWP